MKDPSDQRQTFGWAWPTSVAAHLAIASLVIFGLPNPMPQAAQEQAIQVDLVPPPAEQAEPPPQIEPPPPAEEKPAPSQAEAQPAPLAVLEEVVQFGETDSGPRKSLDGDGAEDSPATGDENPETPAAPEEAGGEIAGKIPEEPAKEPALPEEPATEPALPETVAALPAARPSARVEKPLELQQAQELFSQRATGGALATTAMGSLPRDVRGGRLCSTELREQLQNGLPPYYPDSLPLPRLETGTVIDVAAAAFLMAGQWYDLSFRCQVDADATKVVSFSYRVGKPLPRSEWRRRGLPSG